MPPNPKSRRPRALAAAAAVFSGILAFGASTPAASAQQDIVCPPEATVCQEIRGVPADYRYWFMIRPAPTTATFSFTVNGVSTPGSLDTSIVGTALEGDFWPAVVLVSGDRVCMRHSGATAEYCATTP
ncbi:hypothetical protein [Nonomuraea sp. NPDC049784]|uniref:hypothetical protein n=1 Tax=Nonomuraea sp. NPDC049784 TaxID=3154361 RepID=UPI0033DEFF4A